MNFGKVCIVRIKTLETSVLKNLKKHLFLSVFGCRMELFYTFLHHFLHRLSV